MANIKGGRAARKRDRQNEKARKRNAVCKAKLHDAHKKLFKFADANNRADAASVFSPATKSVKGERFSAISLANTAAEGVKPSKRSSSPNGYRNNAKPSRCKNGIAQRSRTKTTCGTMYFAENRPCFFDSSKLTHNTKVAKNGPKI